MDISGHCKLREDKLVLILPRSLCTYRHSCLTQFQQGITNFYSLLKSYLKSVTIVMMYKFVKLCFFIILFFLPKNNMMQNIWRRKVENKKKEHLFQTWLYLRSGCEFYELSTESVETLLNSDFFGH